MNTLLHRRGLAAIAAPRASRGAAFGGGVAGIAAHWPQAIGNRRSSP